MSGLKSSRHLMGMFSKAIAVGLLALPSVALAGHGNGGGGDGGGSGSTAPAPEALNIAPNVHWFSDWEVNNNPAPTDFYATPFATDGNVPAVQSEMTASGLAGKPLGIKIQAPGLSTAAANALYNTRYTPANKVISYIFGDIEGSPTGAVSNITPITTMVNEVRNSTYAKNAYVGEYGLTPTPNDPFRRGVAPYSASQYSASKVSMANTELYPGAPDFRNKSTFDFANANIRTGLFIGPIGRMTAVQNTLNSSYNGLSKNLGTSYHKQIPWVARFNNWNNNSLDNDPAPGFQFHPNVALPQAGLSASQTANQMMGRGDFSAQILHYRMRGAYSVAAFEPGVVGYTKDQEQDDIRRGWYGTALAAGYSEPAVQHTNNIFAASDAKAATMTLNPIIDGNSTTTNNGRAEQSGTIWSGEYSLNLKKLDILASNLDTMSHMVKFGMVDAYDVFTVKNPNGYTYADPSLLAASRNWTVGQGMHNLLQFDLVTTRVYNSSSFTGSYKTQTVWLLNQNYTVFNNNSRNDTGIPEPTTFGMLAAAGSMAVVCRRQRRQNGQA